MKRLLPILFLAMFAVALVGAAPPPEALVDQANQALAAGEYARAIELYEKAEPRTADPGEVTINLAKAKYWRAVKDGSATDLADAGLLYCCLLGKDDSRRPDALLGLGNCLLQQAGTRDAFSVADAIDQYEECLRVATDETLRADAQHNLERARLLLHQIRKADDEKPNDPDRDPENRQPKPQQPQQNPMGSDPKNPGNRQNTGTQRDPVQAEPGDHPIESDDNPLPGKGNLRPVPDQPDQPPLTAEEAKEHLRLANEHIWRERHQHRMGLAKPPAKDVPDW